MALQNLPGTAFNFKAQGAIPAYLLVAFGTDDNSCKQAVAGSSPLGVSSDVDAVDGGDCDVVLDGFPPVIYGGAVARGDLLKSDANGKAIAAANTDAGIFGRAMVSGVDGDRGCIDLTSKR